MSSLDWTNILEVAIGVWLGVIAVTVTGRLWRKIRD